MRQNTVYSEIKKSTLCINCGNFGTAITVMLLLAMFLNCTPGTVNAASVNINYTYDSLNRLTAVNYGNGYIEEHAYDAAGNRLSLTTLLHAIVINSGASYTNSPAVTLTLLCPDSGGCTQMQFSNDGTTWLPDPPDPFGTTKAWSLSSGDDTKTVYVKFSTDGEVYSNSIILDTSVPVTLSSIPGGSYTSTRPIALSTGSGATIYYTTDGSDPTTSATRKQYTGLIFVTATTTLKYYAVDTAENSESVKTDTYTITSAIISAVNLPKTGQTKCYDTAGVELASCAGTGQDGELQNGVAWPNPRFTSGAGDEAECMIDNMTGLMWPKNGNLPNGQKLWNDAVDYPRTIALCGHSDWRLPNLNELESLVVAPQSGPAAWLNTQGFTNVQASYYWSATTYAYSTNSSAWYVNMGSGRVYSQSKNSYYPSYVWPVRAGQGGSSGPSAVWQTGQTTSYRAVDDGDLKQGVPWPDPRFTDHSNGEVTDNLTGLIWTKDTNPSGLFDCSPDVEKTWQGALDYVKCLNRWNYLGHNDWRLPNWKELVSLENYSKTLPSLPLGHPFTNVQPLSSNYYWSSTTAAGSTVSAWSVDILYGRMVSSGKSGSGYAWPVRAGQFYDLVISKSGSGKVTSDPAGINCGSDCSEYASGTSVTLSPQPSAGFSFTGWSGDCSGTGSCTITMDASKNVTATFTKDESVPAIVLSSGWNFVSFPKQPGNPDITKVLDEISPNIRVVWGYDNQTKTWLKYSGQRSAVSGQHTLTSIEAGKGYWFYINAAGTINMKGWYYPPAATVILNNGWNLIGYTGSDPKDITQGLGTSIDGKWVIIWGWDSGVWYAKSNPLLNYSTTQLLDSLYQGKAYWIKMNADATWQQ